MDRQTLPQNSLFGLDLVLVPGKSVEAPEEQVEDVESCRRVVRFRKGNHPRRSFHAIFLMNNDGCKG